MSIESLTKLAATGNVAAIEDAWIGWLENTKDSAAWDKRAEVLDALAKNNNQDEAVTLATTAIEQFAKQMPPEQAVVPAASFLLALKKSDKMRQVVGDLYKEAFADTPGLEGLMDEAGIYQGRPPRRAVRTLDVCLNLSEGGYLVHREDQTAARVEKIETDPWRITIHRDGDNETRGPVELADEFEVADEDDYRVLAAFEPDELRKRLADDPATVVINILTSRGGTMDSDQLAAVIRGKFVDTKEWTKWFTKTRQALKATHRVEIEGRTPYYLTYREVEQSLEVQFHDRIKRLHDAKRELAVMDEYVKACATHDQAPDVKFLDQVTARFVHRARVTAQRTKQPDLTSLLAAAQVAGLAGHDDADKIVIDALTESEDPAGAIRQIELPQFWTRACDLLAAAQPDAFRPTLEAILPFAPLAAADDIAQRLVEAGADASVFSAIADEICRNVVEMNEGLLWLWSGPGPEAAQVNIPLVTLLTRMLIALTKVDHDDHLPAQRQKDIRGNTRDVLRNRRFARFQQMLDEIELGMATALRTEINRSEGLSRAVREDMLKLLQAKFPHLTAKPAVSVPRWRRDDVLFCTEEGRRARQKEIDELVNVKIRENSIAIGNAAAMGDLSENSEYKFALEERDLLHARVNQLQKEMAMSQVITDRDVNDHQVDIGARVVLVHNDTDARQEVTILGPWETNPKQRVYNYQTPLAQSLLGAKVGEVIDVEFFDPPGAYHVVSIENALAASAATH